jgi:hypothetical protein
LKVACQVPDFYTKFVVSQYIAKMPDFLGDEMRKVKKDDKEEEKEIKCK